MKAISFAQIIVLLLILVLAMIGTSAGTFNSFCQYLPWMRDNVTIKADIADEQLRIDTVGAFRVYIYTTMGMPFYDAKLDVQSEQFDITVTPSPTWKTYPDVQTAVTGGSKEYFTVNLKRKIGVPDGKYDLILRLYSSRQTYRRLARVIQLDEAIDAHTIPVKKSIVCDGKVRPQDWAGSLLLKDFLSYSMVGHSLKSMTPGAQTRIHVASDAKNLYLLVLLIGGSNNGFLNMYFSPTLDGKPIVVTLNKATGTASTTITGITVKPCSAQSSFAEFEISVPRTALGMTRNVFYLNFCRSTGADPNDLTLQKKGSAHFSFWRGNNISVNDPIVYGKMIIK